jgi:DNA-binding NarL/FixJ family response regulator
MPPDLRLAPLPKEVVGAFDPDTIRVVLADDHTAMRRNLKRLLDAEDGVTVVAEAIDLEMAARRVRGHLPEVLILDLHLPSGSAVGLVRELRDSVPETQVVVLTMENSPAFVERALDAGAVGYVLKEHADRDLVPAVLAALGGESYVTPEVAEGLEARRTAIPDSTAPGRSSVTR